MIDASDRQRWAALKVAFIDAIEGPHEAWPERVAALRSLDAGLADELQRLLDGHLETLIQEEGVHQGGLTPGTALGPYVVTELIGEGGMGQVYRATDQRLGRDVAIKVLPPELAADPARRLRMEREARAMGMLNHPNILTVHDIGDHDGSPYIVSELLEGQTLRQHVDAAAGAAGTLAPRATVAIIAAVADALGAAHRRGIVHRDVKPENIFLTSDGRTKVLDFGIAKLTGGATASPGTMAGTIIGTLGYMTPEQLRGEAPRPQTDVYACGVVLYELLSGTRPYAGSSDADVIGAILYAQPQPVPGLAPALSAVVSRCLDRRCEARFADGVDLAAALRALREFDTAAAPGDGAVSTPPFDERPEPPVVAGPTSSNRSIVVTLAAMIASLVVSGLVWRPQWPGTPQQPPPPATTPASERPVTLEPVPTSPAGTPDTPPERPRVAPTGSRAAPPNRRRQDQAEAAPDVTSAVSATSSAAAPPSDPPAPAPAPAPLSGVWMVDEQIAADANAIACTGSGALQLRSGAGRLEGTLRLKRDCQDSKRSATDSTEGTTALSTGTSTEDALSFVTRITDDGMTTTCRYSARVLGSANAAMTGEVTCEARAVGLSAVLSLRGTWRATRTSP